MVNNYLIAFLKKSKTSLAFFEDIIINLNKPYLNQHNIFPKPYIQEAIKQNLPENLKYNKLSWVMQQNFDLTHTISPILDSWRKKQNDHLIQIKPEFDA